MKTPQEIMNLLPAERRAKIDARAEALIAEDLVVRFPDRPAVSLSALFTSRNGNKETTGVSTPLRMRDGTPSRPHALAT